ncbi:MAG: DNA polymerase/3'-5' exonuclease PolX [Nevskia sp.]|nr:DNA polymerase/3'-5' exonuclease PolX [Nevskia sp.]
MPRTRPPERPPRPGPGAGAAAVSNADIAAVFEEIANLLELEEQNPFRIRAYRNAARTVLGFAPDIAALLGSGQALPKLPGIGEDLAAKIGEIVQTGSCALRERLRKEVPPVLVDLLSIPGLGPTRVRHVYHELGVQTPQQLYAAAKDGRLGKLHGFGARLQEKLLQAAGARLQGGRRFPLAAVAPAAEKLAEYLRRAPGVAEVTVAGSFRRMRDTVGDLDILAAAQASEELMRHFQAYPEVAEVLASGPARASVVLRSGLQVDLRAIEPQAYGAALVYFTGSKAHNIAIRKRAQERGFKLSEYGVFEGSRRIAGRTEDSVYGALGLAPVPPELREDRGEIEVAARGRLPHLVERADLRGDLHAHTRASDGFNTLEEMAQAARAAGLEYLAITDHSQRLKVAHGLDAAALRRQGAEIDALNRRLRGITLLKGIEVDILENGDLDLPDEALAQLDLVVGAVHSYFDLPRARQTRRLLRAMEHRRFAILAHPTGRLIGEREGIDVDMPAVIEAARARGCCLELNAQPQRMDLFDLHCRAASERGVPVCVSTDAHRTGDFDNLRYGVGQARRGWLEKKDVLNTRPLAELRHFLKRCMR